MKQLLHLLCCLTLSVTAVSCAKDIVDLTGNIQGTVKDYYYGQSIANCQVSLLPSGKSATTSSSGEYEFTNLPQGEYTLTFIRSGYDEQTKKVTVVSGQTSDVSIMLKAKSAFSLSESVLDFGDFETTKTFYVYNNSDASCSFTTSNMPSWLSFSKEQGTVPAGGSDVITAQINRQSVSEGEYARVVNFTYSGKSSGVTSLSVKFKNVKLKAPVVSIASSAENITTNSFEIKGNVDETGGALITSHGHCWSTSPNPTISGNCTDLGSKSATGSFTSSIIQLSVNTVYYVRAYATNSQGTSYSQQIMVLTQDQACDKWDGKIASSFAGGSGTGVDPYLIKTGGQLLLMKNYSDKTFRLENNIDLNNNNWQPFEFKGKFDGNGHTVLNLYINRTVDQQGLFSVIKNATVCNLNISGVKINAGSNNSIGALAGDFQYGEINNCSVSLRSDSKILGNSNVGGLVGSMGNGYSDAKKISNCSVNNDGVANILGETNVGGILGFMRKGYNGQIEKCSFCGSIKGTSKVGGIVGYEQYGKLNLNKCSVSGTIEGDSYVGGIFGACDHDGYGCTYIYSSKSDVSLIVSSGYAGGIFGGNTCYMNIIACYSKGSISSNNSSCSNIGGIGIGADCELSYSTMSSTLSNYKQLGYMHSSKDCTGTAVSDNITSALRDCYSSYSDYYDFDNTWIWTGKISGTTKNVSCPKLAWE